MKVFSFMIFLRAAIFGRLGYRFAAVGFSLLSSTRIYVALDTRFHSHYALVCRFCEAAVETGLKPVLTAWNLQT